MPQRHESGLRASVILAAIILTQFVAQVQTAADHIFVISATNAFERGLGAFGVKLATPNAVGLYDRTLVEDDGPGIGSDAWWMQTDKAPVTELTGDTQVKKILYIDRLGAKEAHLYLPEKVEAAVNGHRIKPADESLYADVPIPFLKLGENEIVLRAAGPSTNVPHVKIGLPEDIIRNAPDRAGRPRRSFKSGDGGSSWEPIQGEYMIRLHLVQYAPRGSFVSQVIDLGRRDGDDESPLLRPAQIEAVKMKADADTPEGARVELFFRTGRSPVYDPELWSGWRSPGGSVSRDERYVQWKAELSSDDPLKTPLLRNVIVSAATSEPRSPKWAKSLRVVSFHNEEILSTSMPFEYEDPLHPRLAAIRKKYKLDEVVAGAATETERLVRLRDWVAHQWKYNPPEVHYPAWDADEILSRKCGFCVQYAVTFMQCALSLGHQARFVFGHNPGAFDAGGHEVCEVWSNEHRKWVFYDVNQNWFYYNTRAKTPMSMLEVHDLIERTYYGDRAATLGNAPQKRLPLEDLGICYGTNMLPSAPPAEFDRHFADGHYTVPTRWMFVNYVPRNNFFAHAFPQPKTHGTHWDWSEYWRWEDPITPKQWQYRNYTARRNDLNWTLNQVRFEAIATDKPGALRIGMGTFTPYFDTYLIKTDDSGWNESPRSFDWPMHPGTNRLEMRVRNKAGVLGPISYIEVQY